MIVKTLPRYTETKFDLILMGSFLQHLFLHGEIEFFRSHISKAKYAGLKLKRLCSEKCTEKNS